MKKEVAYKKKINVKNLTKYIYYLIQCSQIKK
jgi:hypothetical protein